MPGRPRIDLDGVALADERDETMVLAIFRYRTTEGLVLLMPESGEFLVPWSAVQAADVHLSSGSMSVRFVPEWAAGKAWMRGATVLCGPWVDRYQMETAELLGSG